MIKKAAFLTISIGLVATIFVLFVVAPYHIYTLTLTEGVSTRFLEMKPSSSVLYNGSDFNFTIDLENERNDKDFYKVFHFSHFLIPIPYKHPIFSLIPVIKLEGSGPRLGASFLDGNNVELFAFMLEKPFRFETVTGDQKLFMLPIFRNHILRKIEEDVWRDFFYKKLSLPSNEGKSFYESLKRLREVTYNDLVYNLYILYNRNHFFPLETQGISYDEKTHHGLIKLPSDDQKYFTERLLIREKEFIYPIWIKTKRGNIAAEHFRERILKDIEYKKSTVDSAIPIYAQYKHIQYADRIDQQGMIYLLAAWSHDLSNRDFVRIIIHFLERGKSNLKFLKPFYEYAYKKFGTSFSFEDNYLKETADEKLKRQINKELEVEVTKEKENVRSRKEGSFNSDDEKTEYYLKKVKDNKINTDDLEKVLIQE